jgi:hypothetical protein
MLVLKFVNNLMSFLTFVEFCVAQFFVWPQTVPWLGVNDVRVYNVHLMFPNKNLKGMPLVNRRLKYVAFQCATV